MIAPEKLFQLSEGQKRRKLALTFGELERDIAGIAEKGTEYNFSLPRKEYTKAVTQVLLKDPKLPEETAKELRTLLSVEDFDERRVCNVARNALLSIIGTFPAEWDLVIAPHTIQINGTVQERVFFRGVSVYAEDIRSPFNLGSIFRTAEAMGCEKVYISPHCTDPMQTKALRSSMGCIDTLGYSRVALDDLPANIPIFALETGGTPLTDFVFPKQGIVLLGSEELGLSPQALSKANSGIVTIPMTGLKASLNVGVAFGIVLQAWTEAIRAGRAKD